MVFSMKNFVHDKTSLPGYPKIGPHPFMESLLYTKNGLTKMTSPKNAFASKTG